MAQLRLHGLAKRFGDGKPVLKSVDLDVADGEFMVLVGPSGSGKSTLLRLIAGLDSPSEGSIWIDGRCATEMSPLQRGVAMVFQSYALYPHMTVRGNLGFALNRAGMPGREVAKQVSWAAEMLQIDHLLERKPAALSGGQRQRVAIGRAIVRSPRLFLLDEPLSNLDASLRQSMRIEIARLHQRLAATMIYVTHDQVEAMTLADRIAVFNDGGLQQVGTPAALYQTPANQFVAGFLGSPRINLLPVKVSDCTADFLHVKGPLGSLAIPRAAGGRRSPGEPLTLGIRPESISVDAEGGRDAKGLAASVELVEYLGDHQLLHMRSADGSQALTAKLPADFGPLTAGAQLRLAVAPSGCHLFEASGPNCALAGTT